MSFAYNFYKSDNFFLRFFSRMLLRKLGRINKDSKFPQFILLNHDYVSNDILIDGFYEIKDLITLCEWLKSRKKTNLVIDVGAYIGNHSVFFSKYFKNVISFEPNSFSYKLLQLNTLSKKNIKIYNYGLSKKNSVKDFYSYDLNFGGSSVIQNKNLKYKKIKAKFVKFDGLKIKKKADLIKIDVEGDELNVLKGMNKYILKHKPTIVFECQISEFKNGTTQVIEYLKKNNYKKFYSIENSKSDSLFSKIFYLLGFIFFSRRKYIIKKNRFEHKFYNFIIAEY